MTNIISPSILNADFGCLEQQIGLINQSEADWLHLDIMDGVFVPNITFGFPVIRHIKRLSQKPLDVHLMIVEPDRYIEEFHQHGASILTVHYEACRHLHRTLEHIKSLGMKAGIALNPHTPVHLVDDIIQDADLVLIMTVNPGFGGQKFIAHSLEKVRKMKEIIRNKNTHTVIEVDGGVTLENMPGLVAAGVDAFVAGTAVFKSDDPVKTIHLMKNT